MKELTCILCPKGCRLTVAEDFSVMGNLCKRGAVYAKEEAQNPIRTVTSTVCISGALVRRCPVKTLRPIPKSLVFDAMRLLDDVRLVAPIEEGAVVVGDICGTGIPFVATRSMQES